MFAVPDLGTYQAGSLFLPLAKWSQPKVNSHSVSQPQYKETGFLGSPRVKLLG